MPAAHSVQLLDEAEEENDPAEHEMQLEAVEAPVAAEYVPVSQLVQALAPEEGQYLPWVHSVQLLDEAEEENDPAEHEMQLEAVEAPVAAEYVPAAHPVQTVEAAIYIHTLSHTTLCKVLREACRARMGVRFA